MATYRLTIEGPLGPHLSALNGKTRSTPRRATNLAWEAMWEAMQVLSPMDSQCAQEALAVSTSLDAHGYPKGKGQSVHHKIGPFVFTLTREI